MEPFLFLAALLVFLAYVALAQWLHRLSPTEQAALRAKYADRLRQHVFRDAVIGLLMVFSIIAVSFFGGIYLGNQVYEFVKSRIWLSDNPLCLVEPSWFVIHVTVGFLLFMGLSAIGMVACILAQREPIDEVLEMVATASGYHVVPAMIWLSIPSILLLLALLVLACDNYAVALPNQVVLNEFWGLGSRQYAYTDVVAVEQKTTKHKDGQGNQREIPVWSITFSDGHNWSTQSNIAVEVNPHQLRSHEDFARVVSERSGRPIVKGADRQ